MNYDINQMITKDIILVQAVIEGKGDKWNRAHF